ncbi:prepilin-type N-terminal cleavage/methylation domain-containing protein [Halioglobus maricola]|uniref:Prepilin-type N-terminal cleavage/methylation domain-containing protein n=1 Tax=Halioglobus maricola TaxID=2601894 RepID=A0A5P9NHL3_9GAMM|nr:prepilin-type N-terminal cleavage/methylation domain-containing protein [Halioglobus maricola]QFU75019.1 prepilin-type N-terminal cleavage/methylation domain-containing protein [Halioglobus maricola]
MSHPFRRTSQRGFSLLELLVTLFVVVLVTSLVTLNVGGGAGDYELEGQVDELLDTATYALDEAQFLGWDFGLLIVREYSRDPSYTLQWLERGPDRWSAPRSGKDVFAELELPPGVELELELDGVLLQQDVFSPREELPEPQIVFYSSGETAPGNLVIRASDTGDLLWRVEWDLLGNFRALHRGEESEFDES